MYCGFSSNWSSPTSGPPFDTWVPPPAPSEAPSPPEDPDFQEN